MEETTAPKKRRTPRNFGATLYCYVEEKCKAHVQGHGKKLFGSESAYVNTLICKDMGVKATLGAWQARGEAKKRRERELKEKARKKALYLKKKAQKAAPK